MESVEGRLSEIEEMLKEFMSGMLMLEKSQKDMKENIQELREESKEQGKRIRELYENMKEEGERIRELYENMKEEGERIRELRENMKEEGERIRELREESKEQGKRIRELYESMKEERKKAEDLRKSMEESRKEHEKIWESVKEQGKYIDKISKNLERLEIKQDKETKRFNKEWGALSNKLGTIVEDIIFPATRPVLESHFKCKITDLSLNREKIKDDLQDEFDVIAVSDECKIVFLIEVKSTPKIDYIDEFRNNKIERFRKLFDEYKDYKLIPIFASLRLQNNIINYLTKHKIYAMAYREWEYMDILNFDKLKTIN